MASAAVAVTTDRHYQQIQHGERGMKRVNLGWYRILARPTQICRGLGIALTTLALVGLPAIIAPRTTPAIAQEDWIAAWIDDMKNSYERWILVDLSTQTLTAWEGDYPVYSVTVSTGYGMDETPTGVFAIQSMHTVARMQGEGYDIPDVPYTMYYDGNYAIHGTYWHQDFGVPVSSGCVNVAEDHAAWLYDWSSIGTRVIVRY